MALSGDDITGIILQWWSDYQADPRSDGTKILSGLRSDPQEGNPDEDNRYTKFKYAMSPCQYWIKGLPSICTNWGGSKCNLTTDPDTGLYPSGYNTDGVCDSLGRRHWCSHYVPSTDNPNEYACVANCMERSGLGKQIEEAGTVYFRPYDKSEIAGYNEGTNGIGLCDGNGTGRGAAFYGLTLEEKYTTPPICKHYRPWIMGFGAIKPRPLRKDSRGNIIVPETLADLHDGTKYDPLTPMYAQIPLTFQIYNLRAKFQKCGYWDGEPGIWYLDWAGGYPTLELEGITGGAAGAESVCTCPEQFGCQPYKTVATNWVHGLPDMIQFAWAEAGTVVCNGAKPECPCYTGKWNYVIDDKMRDGMRVTSSQILELRYWADDWDSQSDYEEAFRLKPGPNYKGVYADPATDVIFTFDKWLTFDASDPNESVMTGHSSKLLVPVGEDVGKSFIPASQIELKEVTYPKANEVGVVLSKDEQSYPTLIRSLDGQGFDQFEIPKFTVVYPAEWFTLDGDRSEVTHNVVWMDDIPGVAVIGSTEPECHVYAINLTYVAFDEGSAYSTAEDGAAENTALISYFKTYKSKGRIPEEEHRLFDDMVRRWLNLVKKKTRDYYADAESDSTGAFYFGPLRIPHQGTSEIVVITDYTGYHNYDFRFRTVYSSFWGAWIEQDEFTSALPEESDEGVFPMTPYAFSPAAEVKFTVNSIQGLISTENVFPVVSTMVYGTLGNGAVVSYYITEYSSEATSEFWTQLTGNPSYIWADIGSVDLNLLHEGKIDRAYMSLKEKDDEEEVKDNEINRCIDSFLYDHGAEIDLELVYPNAYKPEEPEEEGLKREHSHPKYALLRTPLVTFRILENGGLIFVKYGTAPNDEGNYLTQRLLANFSKEDWDLNFDFRYQVMEFLVGEAPEDDDTGGGAGEDLSPGTGDDGLADEDTGDLTDTGDSDFQAPSDEEDTGEEASGTQIWPPGNGFYSLTASPIWIEPEGGDGAIGKWKVPEWTNHTAAVFCYNTDSSGRKWAAAATKLIGQMNYLECKNVDIYYAYRAAAKAYDLQPSTGFFTWEGPPTVTPAGGGDTSGGTSGGYGDDPGDDDVGPGTPRDQLIDVSGDNTNDLADGIYSAPSYYDSGAKIHYRRAKCGDHECNPGNCIGPMWFPFNDCTNIDFYDVHCGPGACTASLIPEMDTPIPANFRYGVADQFKASVSPGGNWASSCGGEWYFHYSEASMGGMEFAGKAKVKGRIYRDYYEGMGWKLPPFGLSGRPFVERFMTRDWTSHLMPTTAGYLTVFEFMPYVLDKIDLNNYLNCFESTDEDNPVSEPFIHSSPLSWLSLSAFSDESGEQMPSDADRLRFEEVLNVTWQGLCMYPYPLWPYEFGYRVARYSFTSDSYTWVWRERWNELERAQQDPNASDEAAAARSVNRFAFLDLTQPEYYMDIWKAEHRLVTDEGANSISYNGPVPSAEEVQEAEEKGDAPPDMKYPSIQLGPDGFQRFFKILYEISEYDDTAADWQDEGTQAEASSSGGDYLSDEETAAAAEEEAEGEADGGEPADTPNDGSIYEQANDPPGTTNGTWLHDYNTIFDEFAEPEPNEEERAAVVGVDLDGQLEYKYYNRGLIAGIPKNRLHWLPMYFRIGEEAVVGVDPDKPAIAGCSVWSRREGADPVWTWLGETFEVVEENNKVPKKSTAYRITIKGKWGYVIDKETNTPVYYCIPYHQVDEVLSGITTNTDIGIPASLQSQFNLDALYTGGGESGYTLYKEASSDERLKDNLKDYELEIILDPWPYRMLSGKNLLTLTLEILADNYLAVSSVELVNVLYSAKALEHITVWERKYLPAVASLSNGNPDGPNTKSYRTYDMNLRNAGQYYPAANPGAAVGNFKDKMVIISAGPQQGLNDQNLSVGSLAGLKDIEKNKQRELYEEAFNLDEYDTTRYTKVAPPPIFQFARNNGIPFYPPAGTVTFTSEKISWDMLGYQKLFIEDMDFWQPKGHYFQWASYGTSTRCYLFGTIRDVYTANFVHAHSDVKYRAMSPGHAYNGWARKEYYAGRQAQLEALGRAGDPGSYGYSDGLTEGKNRQGILAR